MHWQQFKELNKVKSRFADVDINSPLLHADKREEAMKFFCNPHSWVLSGPAGRGKTYFSYCLVRGILNRCGVANLLWYKSKALDDHILEEIKKFGCASYFIHRLYEIPILFIDDFGVDRDTERAQRDYYEIIDNRWEDEKPTVITTNLNPKEIEHLYGSRIFSRLKDYKWSLFQGQDLRGSPKT